MSNAHKYIHSFTRSHQRINFPFLLPQCPMPPSAPQRPCECQPKRKRCYCFRTHRNENWLFSRYSTGWKCGLHADWTELVSCVDQELDKNEGEIAKRRYFYITLLRQPVDRYLSEFRHVQRGATWKTARHWCLGRQATTAELPLCYPGAFRPGLALAISTVLFVPN